MEEEDCDCDDPAQMEEQKRSFGDDSAVEGGPPRTVMTIPDDALEALKEAEAEKKSGTMGTIPGGM